LTGTGGTIAGVGRYLKANNEDIVVALADPEGSGLYNKANHPLVAMSATISHFQVKHGVMYDRTESEGTKRRHQVDTVVEGM
jgi:cysteine synthase